MKDFDESIHHEELMGSYKISDLLVRLCHGKMCLNAPLLMSVHPDRREQKGMREMTEF